MADATMIAEHINGYIKDETQCKENNFYIACTYQDREIYHIMRINTDKYLLKTKEQTCPHIKSESYDIKKFTKEQKKNICLLFEEYVVDIMHRDFDNSITDTDTSDCVRIVFEFVIYKINGIKTQSNNKKIICDLIPINDDTSSNSDMSLISDETSESSNDSDHDHSHIIEKKDTIVYKNTLRFFDLISEEDEDYKKQKKNLRKMMRRKFRNVFKIFDTYYEL